MRRLSDKPNVDEQIQQDGRFPTCAQRVLG